MAVDRQVQGHIETTDLDCDADGGICGERRGAGECYGDDWPYGVDMMLPDETMDDAEMFGEVVGGD